MLTADERVTPTNVDTTGARRGTSRHSWLMIVALLAGIVGVRGLLTHWTIRQGFVEYNADGFSRMIRGWEWLQAPRWEVELWLPLHFWFYGAVFWLWEDLFLASRVANLFLGLLIVLGIYLIGATLKDRQTGIFASLIAAVFPYEIWLSVSGMSEPLYHALLVGGVLGFVWWGRNESIPALLAASVALLAASAVRYEAWFFIAAFLAVVASIIFIERRSDRIPAIGAGTLSIGFILVWLQQNWSIHGDPLAFAQRTEAAKLAEDPGNVDAGLIERVLYFPDAALTAAPGLVLLGLAAAALLMIVARDRWWPLLALVFGQAVVMVAVTSMFASQGPGAERYLLANTLLLALPVAGALTWLIDRYCRWGLAIAAVLLAVLFVSFLPDWMYPPVHYPAADTRTLAAELRDDLDNIDGNAVVLLPSIPDERFNEGYALHVRSGKPDRVEITDVPSRLYEAVQQGEARIWVIQSSLEDREPPATERWQVGGYTVGVPPLPAEASTSSTTVQPGEELNVDGSGFLKSETIATWWTGPDESVHPGPELEANAGGEVVAGSVDIPEDAAAGQWVLTLAGNQSQRQAFVTVEVTP